MNMKNLVATSASSPRPRVQRNDSRGAHFRVISRERAARAVGVTSAGMNGDALEIR